MEGLQKGLTIFNEAVEKDSSYALAYVGLATLTASSVTIKSFAEAGLPASEAGGDACSGLDERLAEAHAALAFIKAATIVTGRAREGYRRASNCTRTTNRTSGMPSIYRGWAVRGSIAEIERPEKSIPFRSSSRGRV